MATRNITIGNNLDDNDIQIEVFGQLDTIHCM